METRYRYVIVGGGLAAASAVTGIREHDPEGSILLLSRENHPPYHRPPLSKGLWTGKETFEQLPVHPDDFYREQKVELALRREVVELDPAARRVWHDRDGSFEYEKLLLATGGRPRPLEVPGSLTDGVLYFRSLEDFMTLQDRIERLQHVLLIGSGFIGMELAAALRGRDREVTLVYPEEYPLRRVLPRDLGLFVADYYRERGVETISGESVRSIEEQAGLLVAKTAAGNQITTQLVVAGVGMLPNLELAEAAGIEVDVGIEVDEFGRTSDANVFAAGDVAQFPLLALKRRTRSEHWDHAREHGRVVGANMAGAEKPYDHLPMFYSDLFDLGWEAVGEVSSEYAVDAVWKVEHREGVLYYLDEDVVVGVLLWNVWGQVDRAREIVRAQQPTTAADRRSAIPLE
ncbi:MAG: FAD-dependent oxidoreductase [Candidatus Eisenbacteria bacterium]